MKYFDALVSLSDLLQQEKKHEQTSFEEAVRNRTIHERKKSGNCLYPLSVKEVNFGLAGYLEIVLESDLNTDTSHFSSGNMVSLFKSSDSIKSQSLVTATIKNCKANILTIQLKAEEEPEDLYESKLGLDKTIDDRTYRVMEHTLNKFINTEDQIEKTLLKKIWGDQTSKVLSKSENFKSEELNSWQNQAVNLSMNSEDFMAIHGPPGTGKTTTLVQCIKQAVKTEKRVLVCANSNAAVDHLVRSLIKVGVSVVRLGNLARVDQNVQSHQLDFKIQEELEYSLIKDLKKRAIDSRKKAEKYKRSFNAEDRENRRNWYKEARELIKEARETEKYLINKVIKSSQVVATTLIGSDHEMLWDIDFNTVFIDEAAQALIPASLTPLKRANKIVLAGDPFQLPPLVKNNAAAKKGLEKSLLEIIMETSSDRVVKLKTQYRMDTSIMGFSNEQFYENELEAHESVANHGFKEDSFEPVEFIDTAGCNYEETSSKSGFSLMNLNEAKVLKSRLEEFKIINSELSIGVISPYRGQVNLLKETLENSDITHVNTIDAFQGQERDLIIVSLVRSNEDSEIGFLKDYRRMNVALTRARKKLILIGDSATIGSDKFYGKFLEFVEGNGSYRSAWEYM